MVIGSMTVQLVLMGIWLGSAEGSKVKLVELGGGKGFCLWGRSELVGPGRRHTFLDV
jgi:hypothetical protein